MKYNKGDKFLIEIESRLANEQVGLYKVKGFRTLVLDDNSLDRLEQAHEKSGYDDCKGCEHEEQPTNISPCDECSRNMLDFWTPKPEEIQVGDEVKFTSPNTQESEYGIVLQKYDRYIGALDRDLIFRSWGIKDCTRTGKTYPELIKALEQLPKE